MSDLPPVMRVQRKIDADHLRLLAIFHFIAAAFALLGVLFLWGHYTLTHSFMSNPKMWTSPHPQQGRTRPNFSRCSAGLRLHGAVLRRLRRDPRDLGVLPARAQMPHVLDRCPCIICLYMPLGTILGVFTILVLVRDTVREVYEAQ